jgi:hypothetical protein
MYLIGDVHGKIDRYLKLVNELPASAQSIQVGDMHIGFPRVCLPTMKHHKFIRGNHDHPQKCKEHANFLGEYGYLEQERLFYMGGAISIDWRIRRNGVLWWEAEQLSDAELNDAAKLYGEVRPRVVVSHECPAGVVREVLKGLIGNCFLEKAECINSRTCQALQRMFEIHKPEIWTFGHYHVNKEFVIDSTTFRCVAELSVFEIPAEQVCSGGSVRGLSKGWDA